ncbi:MAG: dephospho-CoA kinase [Candidatus Cloacimonetes bacterium]|nr:dephospho-CoA kinase [Candidatus Cloacimonadota bacterium]MCF7813812.1 dephospho-CoA kinase [Candidatus Cloacimonadota bacterium]MCF7868491.1 dephospho-CoA kinase [Candidatus Cloacimonadota bacterium]
MNSSRPFLIAVTGGIACGKSAVCKWFENKNIKVYYSDKLAHEVLQENDVIQKLTDNFGDEILSNGKIDRKKLGKLVFNNPQKLAKLNRVIHPEVLRKIHEIILFSDSDYLVFEIPLLFESGLQNAFDLSMNIFSEECNQVERIEKRDKLSTNEGLQRIQAQMNSYDKQKLADINIENNGTIAELNQKLNNLWPLIKKMKKQDIQNIMKI